MTAPRLLTHTLGCKVNQYETQYVREGLLRAGYVDVQPDQAADLCIINTCTVTADGDAKSRRIVRRIARRNPDARLIVMGCYATRAPEEIAQLPGVDEVITDKRELPDLLGRFGVVDVPTGISGLANRHRAYVKVQDGCLLRCTYCIIPQVRPEMYSRKTEEILDEVRRLVDNGYQEIVLTGIHLGHYGVDWNRTRPKAEWIRLSDLVKRIVQLPGEFRVRLSSIEATEVTRELISVMANHPTRICPHLHVCLQSGSDRILDRMNRRWGSKRFLDRCHLVRQALPNPALTTDIIVGFPGETDADFLASCDVARQAGFSKIHVFPFSSRKGTPAADMDQQIPSHVKSARVQQLQNVERELRSEYLASLAGRELRVLVEGQDTSRPDRFLGTSCRYVPVMLSTNATPSPIGKILRAEPISHDGKMVLARQSESYR
jgi:threonylcarbamoyladenosine tRNA methylthiotransferase MtaB